ncbi:MAG: hypothetical protein P4K94_04740 [Terracidiphilus sp.]|nr:hypothetical protein [Terracidiphilus sp.]
MIRRITDDNAGFVKDVSDIIALEALKHSNLIPNLSGDKTLFLFSDYSRVRGHYKTYSFLVLGRSGADFFNGARKKFRKDFGLGNRQMSFKGLNDKVKLRSLPAFLSLAGALNGFILTFAVSTSIPYMFAEQFLPVWPELAKFKKPVLEEMLRIAHFGAQAVLIAFNRKQNIVWFTDEDNIVANDAHQDSFGRIAQAVIRGVLPNEEIGRIGFGLTGVDDGSFGIEDLAAIPDLVAGALCELLDTLSEKGQRITPRVDLTHPAVSGKTDMICEWIGKIHCPLKKFSVTFDLTGPGTWDWRPTFFRIKNMNTAECEFTCPAQRRAQPISEPIRFDIGDQY